MDFTSRGVAAAFAVAALAGCASGAQPQPASESSMAPVKTIVAVVDMTDLRGAAGVNVTDQVVAQ